MSKDFMISANKIFILLMLLSILTACNENNQNSTIRVSLLPDTSQEQLSKRYTPLLDYLTKKSDINFHLVHSKSYSDLYNKFITKEIDLALFGGFTYLKAHKNNQAEPLIFRDTDERFHSVVLIKTNNPAKTLSDLKNTVFSFGSKLSTSGHVMPRYFFSKQNINPETFFKNIIYSGSHHKTAELIKTGHVNAGVANEEIVNRMYQDGRLNKRTVRILWTSPPYPDYVWAIQPSISIKTKNKIKEAFLSLNNENREHATILKNVGANYFLPATHENFVILEKTVNELNLIK